MVLEALWLAAAGTASGDISSWLAAWDASRACSGGQLPGWEMLRFLNWLGAWWLPQELGAPSPWIEPTGAILSRLGIFGVPVGRASWDACG